MLELAFNRFSLFNRFEVTFTTSLMLLFSGFKAIRTRVKMITIPYIPSLLGSNKSGICISGWISSILSLTWFYIAYIKDCSRSPILRCSSCSLLELPACLSSILPSMIDNKVLILTFAFTDTLLSFFLFFHH